MKQYTKTIPKATYTLKKRTRLMLSLTVKICISSNKNSKEIEPNRKISIICFRCSFRNNNLRFITSLILSTELIQILFRIDKYHSLHKQSTDIFHFDQKAKADLSE